MSWSFCPILSAEADGMIYGIRVAGPRRWNLLSGRMGTCADVLFAPGAMASLLDAVEERADHGGLSGRIESDGKGEYRYVTGAGRAEVGMFFRSEGTEADDSMASKVRTELGEGVLVVIDPDVGELAVYLVDSEGCRMASALMSE